MEYKVVESKEIVWCPNDDRYILIIKKDDDIVGLSFMQGEELESFKEHYGDIDYELTDFYNAVEPYLVHDGTSEVDRINAAIWSYFEFRNLRNEREYNNKLNK
jgi:hypothetical protein